MNTPLSFGLVLFAVVLSVSQQQNGIADILLVILFGLLLLLPILLRSRFAPSAASFVDLQHPLGRRFLAVHGLLYLTVLQPFALLWSAEYLMPHVTGSSHGVALMTMTVTAGSFAVAGNAMLVRMVGRWSAAGLTIIALLVTVNAFLFHYPLYAATDRSILQFTPMSLAESFGLVIAASVLMFWMNTLELGAAAVAGSGKNTLTAPIIAVLSVCGLAFLVIPSIIPAAGAAQASSVMSMLISFITIAGIGGLFAASVSSAGVVFADRFFHDGHGPAAHEKYRLMNKLAVVFSAIAAVLLIPIVRSVSSDSPERFFALLAAFASPVVAAYLISSAVRKHRPFALSFGMLLGSGAAAAEFILQTFVAPAQGNGIIVLTAAGSIATAAGYAVIAVLQELVVVQRLLSMMRHS